jgi:hypothetical protein
VRFCVFEVSYAPIATPATAPPPRLLPLLEDDTSTEAALGVAKLLDVPTITVGCAVGAVVVSPAPGSSPPPMPTPDDGSWLPGVKTGGGAKFGPEPPVIVWAVGAAGVGHRPPSKQSTPSDGVGLLSCSMMPLIFQNSHVQSEKGQAAKKRRREQKCTNRGAYIELTAQDAVRHPRLSRKPSFRISVCVLRLSDPRSPGYTVSISSHAIARPPLGLPLYGRSPNITTPWAISADGANKVAVQ